MSRKASTVYSKSGSSLPKAAVSQPSVAGSITGAEDKGEEVLIFDADIVNEINSLTIETNAKRGAKGSTKTVTDAKSDAAVIKEISPPPSSQVISDVANANKVRAKGAKPKIKTNFNTIVNPGRSSNTVENARSTTRLNANQRVHITRYSHCELCSERDTSRMVQCDGCDKWYHFSCVEVTSGVANHSWICPKCPYMHFGTSQQVQQATKPQQAKLVDPPPKPANSNKSTGKASSNRSNQRKVDLMLLKLEEQRRLEQKYLDEKYRILEEGEEEEDTSDHTFDDVGSDEISKVRGWLRDTENYSEACDSGLIDEEINDDQLQPVVQQVSCAGHAEPRSTFLGFIPNQRSTPQATDPMNTRAGREVVQAPVPGSSSKDLFHRPTAIASVPKESTRRAIIPSSVRYEPSASASQFQFRRPPVYSPEEQFRSTSLVPPENQCYRHQGPLLSTALNHHSQGSRSIPNPRVQFRESPIVQQESASGNQASGFDSWPDPSLVPEPSYRNPSTPINQIRQGDPDPNYQDNNDNVCVLNRNKVAARQAVSKDLPDFYGEPEDWPLFFSIYCSSTQIHRAE